MKTIREIAKGFVGGLTECGLLLEEDDMFPCECLPEDDCDCSLEKQATNEIERCLHIFAEQLLAGEIILGPE